jgi:hydroxymethylpyrimidine/phosphomethylpyrimidine kinase
MVEQGEALRALGARAVLMKGGHLSAADSPDWLVQDSGTLRLGGPRVPVKNTHGTGCTLSSAIAALIPQRGDLASAVADAKLVSDRRAASERSARRRPAASGRCIIFTDGGEVKRLASR